MNLWFRTLLIVLKAFIRPKVDAQDVLRLRLTCLPTDLDVAMHMNNGRYLSIADLGRWALIIRSGFVTVLRQRGWHPVVGTSKIWHRRSLMPFQRFDLTTRIIGWDEKWTYLEHRFEGTGRHKGDLYCRIVVKTLFLEGREKIPTARLLDAMGIKAQSPEMDPELFSALA
jgi:acyl-CoA thioesterase FadM